jgi:hypothetical protein
MVGVYYNDLPDELTSDHDKLYDFIEDNSLNYASLWYDSGMEGRIIGRIINNDIPEQNLDSWLVTVKQALKRSKVS